jgi:Putative auto-transporter adhesin, head GIN domain
MNKSSIILMLLAFFLIPALFSCKRVVGTGPIISETRVVSNFTKINLDMDANIKLSQGNVFSVTVDAQRNVLDEIQTNVSGNTLTVKHKNATWITGDDITVHITLPSLASLNVSGSGIIDGQTAFTCSDLKLCISGSGEINFPDIQANTIESNISGSGQVNIKNGTADNIDSDISGSGDVYASYVLAKKAVTHTSGSGTTKLNVSQQLDAHISGSGDVYYKGNPIVNASISGSGKVIHQD